MKRTLPAAAFIALLSSGAFAADLPKAIAINENSSMNDIQQALTNAGFANVTDLQQNGNVIRAKGVYGGQPVEFVVGARTGRVYDQTKPVSINVTSTTSDQEIQSQLNNLGYNITEIERRGNVVVATGQKAGTPVEVIVDTQSGRFSDDLHTGTGIDYIRTRASMDNAYLADQLKQLGYSDVGELKQSGNIYRTTANKGGVAMNVRINGETGAVTSRR